MVAFGYRLVNVLGKSFTGGNLVFTPDGETILSPVGNRVVAFSLVSAGSRTLDAISRADIEVLALSSAASGDYLLAVDVDGRALFISLVSGAVLHRFRFCGGAVQQALFAPDGERLAVGVGSSLQIWQVPTDRAFLPEFAPFVRVKTIAAHPDQVTALAWSPSGQLLLSGARDHSLRLVHANGGFDAPISLRGHRDVILWTAFGQDDTQAYSLSVDGTLITWRIAREATASIDERERAMESVHEPDGILEDAPPLPALNGLSETLAKKRGNDATVSNGTGTRTRSGRRRNAHRELVRCLNKTNLFIGSEGSRQPRHVRVTCAHALMKRRLLALGLSNGVLMLVELEPQPEPGAMTRLVQQFSVSAAPLSAITIHPDGEWIALASALTSALIVWEWTSEKYVLKQQGHWLDLTCLAYAPRGDVIATGAADGLVKLWSTFTGFCALTLDDLHTQRLTGLAFSQRSGVLFSCSTDGTVRAIDLKRYRAFRTLRGPAGASSGVSYPFTCLAADESGDLVAAGCKEPFVVCVWHVRTGQLLETLAGHEAPISAVAFNGVTAEAEGLRLASASWDGTVRLWALLATGSRLDAQVLRHAKEVLTMAFHPDGRELVSATADGTLTLWDTRLATVRATLETRRDCEAAGARDAPYVSTLCYTTDGQFLLASGGDATGVLVYSRATLQCIRRIELFPTFMCERRSAAKAAPATSAAPASENKLLRALAAKTPSSETRTHRLALRILHEHRDRKRSARMLRVQSIQVAPGTETWAAATTDGLFLFAHALGSFATAAPLWRGSLGAAFDPVDLAVDVTPSNMLQAIREGRWALALSLALRLNEPGYVYDMLGHVPADQVDIVVRALSAVHVPTLISLLAEALVGSLRLKRSRHWEYLLRWCSALLVWHGEAATRATGTKGEPVPRRQLRVGRNYRLDAALLALHRALLHYRDTLERLCDENRALLQLCVDSAPVEQVTST
jgi:periodic tryptophan protein 2